MAPAKGPAVRVVEAAVGSGWSVTEKEIVCPKNWLNARPVWLMVVLVVGKKAEKVLPSALKLTVMEVMGKKAIVTVTGLVKATW